MVLAQLSVERRVIHSDVHGFLYGHGGYLWPLLIMVTDSKFTECPED